ncbi:MAG TPA: PilZ domain-containing protein [Terriglobales bacterium]|nr:PilZ domain-containing protein [Terriglobales bacterium]
MSSNERRIAPRKIFSIPIRIRPLASESLSVAAGSTVSRNATTSSYSAVPVSPASSLMNSAVATSKPVRVLDMQEGETVNLSERGIYFKTAQKVKIGQAMEIYFTLPRELTGRNPEPVRCSARVVHVEQYSDERGWTGVGASVEQFEPLQRFRTWDN